ncbi:ankyrin repeat-containing protein BDA1-like isoform X2 [Carya illinoinensis]|uniref:PGG domain-containing protein n=2 Tax=Carya illinoinensis TaxID=32201 RepID=A0A8T1P4M5_CARIL|nr:ankyrin repeat-containing protein BDA1-like isoform X2 [Carya illinoinensis]KAG6635877.1 hypothetical protein CIPAW_11G073500 [Carya illinoinensis]
MDLRDAAQQGNTQALYCAIKKDPGVLDKIDKIPFVETPLHTAASKGQIEFAMEIMMLKPSFARKLDQDGFTPMHLALKFGRTQLVLRLLDVDKGLVRVQGRGGVSPLHYATENGELDLLVEFLKACPMSIEDVTNRRETALHIALNNQRFATFQFLIGWLRRAWFIRAAWLEKKLLNWQDGEGNTLLHLAVLLNEPEVVRCIVNCISVDKNIKNSANQTAIELILEKMHKGGDEEIRIKRMISSWSIVTLCAKIVSSPLPEVPHLKTFISSRISIFEKCYIFVFREYMELGNDTRNMLLVVATLAVTATYQAALSPPGGVWQDNSNAATDTGASELLVSQPSHQAGRVIMSTGNSYLFFTLNTLNFFTNSMTIIFLLPLGITRLLVILPLWALTICYFASTHIIFRTTVSSSYYLLLLFLASFFYAFTSYNWFKKLRNLIQAFHPMARMLDPSFRWGWYNSEF